ncbi:MAG TPA: hypothetical protein VFF73_36000 [Planctomycetota bacterium]|nr:hypothetical protein [Planctomycetota bacterium]
MKRPFLAVSLVAFLVLGAHALAEGPEFKVEVAGVRSVWPNDTGDFSVRPMWGEEGFSVAVLVKGQNLIAIEPDDSKIGVVADDAKKDLTAAKGWNKPQVKNTNVAKDGKAGIAELYVPTAPTRGAKSVHVEASVAIVTANGTEKKEGSVELKKGTKIEFGMEPLEISKVEDQNWNKDFPHGLTVTSKKPLHWLAGLTVKGEDGKEMKTADGGGGWSSSGHEKTYERTILLPKKLEKATLVLEVRKDLKTVEVPVNLDVSIGG